MASPDHQPFGFSSVFLLLLFPLIRAATTALGPTAVMSIASSPAWATMKPCAQGCFIDNSLYHSWPCNMKGPAQWDLGLELSCGCSPQNFCFCKKEDGAKASAYISSCVNTRCAGSQAELTSAIQLYDGYCKTANVEVAAVTTSASARQTSTTKATNPSAAESNTARGAASNTALDSSSTETTPSASNTEVGEEGKKKGLTQSDIVAIAVGLGVGIPSLLLALATYFLARRNSRQNQAANRRSKIQYQRQQ